MPSTAAFLSQARPIVDAAMALAAERGWPMVTPSAIAQHTGLPLSAVWGTLPHTFSARAGLLQLAVRLTDAAMLDAPAADPNEPGFDRLFEVLMRRIDALAAWKPGIAALQTAVRHDPALAAALACTLRASPGWILAAAGLDDAAGLRGCVRQAVLADVWRRTLTAWLADDDVSLGKTMAALDQALRRHAGRLGISAPASATV
jgi:hypothetical protein